LSAWVKTLCATRDGTLWVGIAVGLLRWKNDGFEETRPPAALSTAVVTALLESRDGVLWAVSRASCGTSARERRSKTPSVPRRA
jgi:ligand-binding sensor domain-containing protein